MSEVWFVSDTHFGHKRIMEYCQRPFKSVEEMDETILENLRSVVKPTDLLFFLGDLSFHPERYISRLSGRIYFVMGNHDRRRQFLQGQPNVSWVSRKLQALRLSAKELGHEVFLYHYSLRTWYASHFGAWHLFGHSHGRLTGTGKSFDVGVDAHDFRPWSWQEVQAKMETLPDNPGLVKDHERR